MSKIITLMRHGHNKGSNLSDQGRNQASDVATQIVNAGLLPDVILSSPVGRAEQTAKVLKGVFQEVAGRNVPIKILKWLDSESNVSARNFSDLGDSSETSNAKNVLVVTHFPQIKTLAACFHSCHEASHADACSYEVESSENWSSLQPKGSKLCGQFSPAIFSC